MTIFSEEVRKGEEEGLYEYQPLDGIGFKRAFVMREANEELFALKAKAKAGETPSQKEQLVQKRKDDSQAPEQVIKHLLRALVSGTLYRLKGQDNSGPFLLLKLQLIVQACTRSLILQRDI